ncbi:glutathione peroxidase-type tryparedoxin peroxidase [Strigomonas culicis]|uniref:Glutathione peroxidase n=1 Tax=Strigomonas culicis TaxID=28005 RepID=S9VGD3_9TRYP|nr:glutathione peroxidase-type tryparedoxin peroxidase [Strigomonas culicis]|eukprot:EPY26076.1 glutathione peroxidase-type tryparedoxin peroxidase [Strigomonas culicis]
MSSIYDFTVNGADHKPYDLQQHKGHPLLIVNVASQCGYTKSGYETATALYNKFKDQGFTVLAFPCNQFGAQEPGTEQEIQQTTCTRFKAEFPLLEKVEVNGDKALPLYTYLKEKQHDPKTDAVDIKWNFNFFLVDKEGVPVARFLSGTDTETIEKAIAPLL